MIANHLANGRKRKVAILELNRNTSFSKLIHFDMLSGAYDVASEDSHTGSSSCFDLIGVDFYRNISESDISKIMTEKYDYIILDVSGNHFLGRKEFLRSDKKIIVGSLSRWRAHEYYNYFEKAYAGAKKEDCIFLTLAGDRKLLRKIRNNYGAVIRQIPFEEDPFYMRGSNMKWIEEVLK